MKAEFSAQVKSFMKEHIASVWQLELLLYFRNRGQPASVRDANSALYLEERAVQTCIDSFVAARILKPDETGMYFYGPSSALAKTIDEVAYLYATRRTTVINFIYSSPIQSFSDAFRIRKDKED